MKTVKNVSDKNVTDTLPITTLKVMGPIVLLEIAVCVRQGTFPLSVGPEIVSEIC